ncbi:hypothetical protein WISP_110960 [Willisornis vidua]|uniref:Uncharacterized protein n=1 Tax=Willisornis vidua TaxID=1566151 RepID=A0ABQ9D0Y9_9PASS|nr:hypothetical protein WISP_110960 [Willisornis vidua]
MAEVIRDWQSAVNLTEASSGCAAAAQSRDIVASSLTAGAVNGLADQYQVEPMLGGSPRCPIRQDWIRMPGRMEQPIHKPNYGNMGLVRSPYRWQRRAGQVRRSVVGVG